MKDQPEINRKPDEPKKKGISRRGFLVGAGALTVAGTVAADVVANDGISILYRKRALILKSLIGDAKDKNEGIQKARKFLKDEYGVDVRFGDTWSEDSFSEDLTAGEAAEALQIVVEEMGKYPQDFFKRNKLSEIRLAKHLELKNGAGVKAVGGFARMERRSIALEFDSVNEGFMRGTFHHETYHVLDFWREGGLESDVTWDQIHEGCICNPHVRREKHEDGWFDRSFINPYGETSPIEERAEFGRMLMTPDLHANFLWALAQENEPIRGTLQRKYDAIRDDYYKWSGGKMDKGYWNAVVASAPKTPTFYFDDYSNHSDSGDDYGSGYYTDEN